MTVDTSCISKPVKLRNKFSVILEGISPPTMSNPASLCSVLKYDHLMQRWKTIDVDKRDLSRIPGLDYMDVRN